MGIYVRLTDFNGESEKEKVFLSGEMRYSNNLCHVKNIPGMPIAYWLSDKFSSIFDLEPLREYASACIGMRTGDNGRFLRFWHEVEGQKVCYDARSSEEAEQSEKKWFPYNKGGEFRKWYGNNEYLVNWEHDGEEIKENTRKVYPQLGDNLGWKISNERYYFQEGITWTVVTNKVCFRRYYNGHIFSNSGQAVVCEYPNRIEYLLGLLNSKVAEKVLHTISPTLGFESGYVNKIPVILQESSDIDSIVRECIELSKDDWNAFENSWEFNRHPLIQGGNMSSRLLREIYAEWENQCNERFDRLKANEERLNQIFIDMYGLNDEMDSAVEDKDVSIRKADVQRDIKSLISYAVGCMFGRYSLVRDGVIYAGGEKHFEDSDVYGAFLPESSNIIPITDEEYFENDIVSRFVEFMKIVYGADTLEENLKFIAEALDDRGKSSREVIRKYFMSEFVKEHNKNYQKCPIYWLFESGKQNGFKALIYMHRYDADTIGNLRIDYLHRLERIYESEITRMQDMIENSASSREVTAASKRKEKLQKQLKECQEYDEKIGHLALARVEINLDDGVKVNYEKVQTASDGKKYSVLSKV